MEQNKLKSTYETIFDLSESLGLLCDRMKTVNGVVYDKCCYSCSLDENSDKELLLRARELVNNQPTLAIMSCILSDYILDLEQKIDTLTNLSGDLYYNRIIEK